MKRLILIFLGLVCVTAQPFAQTQSVPSGQSVQRIAPNVAPIRTMLDNYCIACHGKCDGDSGTAVLNAVKDNAEVTALIRAAKSKEAGVAPLTR